MMQQKHEKTKYRNQNIAKYAQENSQIKKEEFNAPKKIIYCAYATATSAT